MVDKDVFTNVNLKGSRYGEKKKINARCAKPF
jgi:hypothetical protein